MTIETLEKYRGVAQNVEAINAEIDALYAPIRSPNGRAERNFIYGNNSILSPDGSANSNPCEVYKRTGELNYD